ncbi:hypothetical protein GCM10022419_131130 [Nonomuraea rosea]|uniref:Uncharacterized protein n=1 Tax=Nonomuraea rosea TaxID=638574 RepID=A0ABP7A1R8_9ACTN
MKHDIDGTTKWQGLYYIMPDKFNPRRLPNFCEILMAARRKIIDAANLMAFLGKAPTKMSAKKARPTQYYDSLSDDFVAFL